ncbi:hypothetical protein ABZ372_51970, partial [Streptomyces sp. NPDC005921]
MPWDFETEPDYQAQLDWADQFVREEVEPLDLLWDGLQFTPPDDNLRSVLDPLKKEVRAHGLWATHLGPTTGSTLPGCAPPPAVCPAGCPSSPTRST